MQNFIYFGLFILLCHMTAQAEVGQTFGDSTSKASVTLEGMIGVSVGVNAVAFNVGGPNFKVRFKKAFAVGVGAFPSMIFAGERTEPKLGLSPRIDYKNWVLIAPCYHFTRPDEWVYTFGVGYKFH